MATNTIPKTYADVVALAEDAADGASAYQTAVGLKQKLEAAIRADLAALTGAEATAASSRTAKATAAAANQVADSNGKAFIARFIQFPLQFPSRRRIPPSRNKRVPPPRGRVYLLEHLPENPGREKC